MPGRHRGELGPCERYLGSVMRSVAVTVGLHLSLTVADLPCLQAWVVSLDLEIHTTVMYLIFDFFNYVSSLKQGVHGLDLNEF